MNEAPALVVLRCRDADDALDELAAALGERLGVVPRAIGSPPARAAGGADADLAASRGCLLEAGGQLEDALGAGRRLELLAGDAAIALTTLPTLARLRPDARVLWLDAHACFDTPERAPGQPLARMALSGACGYWDSGLPGVIDPRRVVCCGTRVLRPAERELLERARVTVIGTTLETLVYVQNALDGAATYVHLDLDVIDPEELARPDGIPEGLTAEKVLDLLDAVADTCEVLGVQVTGPAPGTAAVVADLLAPLA